ncbi:hypothetical protein SBRCBS47491_001350 [Sporothrix bragantina]|uniref:PH domain-containing protein n=1 Tax=Sporothrix bragantina TaxID=671064 RepID=A0ABP0AXS8_9PEZI
MSQLSGGSNRDSSRTPSPTNHDDTFVNLFGTRKAKPSLQPQQTQTPPTQTPSPPEPFPNVSAPSSPIRGEHGPGALADRDLSFSPGPGRQRSSSRPVSMIQTYQPHLMDTNNAIPELQPIYTLLNSHANKLYQEGYFLKLDDQNTQGRPNPDRNWTECFAQLVGTVLSLWDAAELDTAGEDGEVLPKFINLTDASIKVIDSLPTRSANEQPLQNVLSVSTAGRNRYLLHFNSHHSMIQWTAGIRLAMYEHSTLQEAYTGALIAGKGKSLNNINLIMSRSKVPIEEWVRVRFGAGVPWRRCWCVISPPDEKEVQKLQKDMKKRSVYDRSHLPQLKGDIKFYDKRVEGKKQKKAKPIATVTNAYSAYAIYPQSKALIDASSLIKLEGTITIHSNPASTTEGFMFMMPEVRPMVSGFEMLLRSLFPTWDTFCLYGRPQRLVASTLDTRSLMFAMPKHRRNGYLEIMDVSTLVLTEGSGAWSEREWRKRLRDLTGKRMAAMDESASSGFESERTSNRSSKRLSFGPGPMPMSASAGVLGGAERSATPRARVNFADDGDSRVSRSTIPTLHPASRTDSAPPSSERQHLPSSMAQAATISHARNNSDMGVGAADAQHIPYGAPPAGYYDPTSSGHGSPNPGYYPAAASPPPARKYSHELATTPERLSSEDDVSSSRNATPPRDLQDMNQRLQTPEPVTAPPTLHHPPSSRPAATPYHSPELRRANSRLSNSTLAQIVNAGTVSNVSNEGWPMPDNQDRRPSSRGSGRSGQMSSSSSVPSFNQQHQQGYSQGQGQGQQGYQGLPTSNTAPHLTYSKSPLNQAHNALAPAFDVTPQAASSMLAATALPQVPPHTGHMPTHMHGAESGRRVLLAQGHTPSAPSTSNTSPSPAALQSPPSSSQNQEQPRSLPERLRTPPPNAGRASISGAPALSPIQTSPPIHRKPVPPKTDSEQRYKESSTEPQSAISSAGSLQDYYIDEAALAKVHTNTATASNSRNDSPLRQEVVRQDTKRSEASSHYDDASSTTTTDYASTHESIPPPRESVERPRAGILRTVGNTTPPPPRPNEELNIPEVNFGPTYNYASANAPRSKTPTGLGGNAPTTSVPNSRSHSPGPQAAMAAAGAAAASGSTKLRKSPNHKQRPSDLSHTRQDSDDTVRRRSVAWQPGGAMAGTTATAGDGRAGSMTPEQFVLQRAQAAQASGPYPHQRVPSNNSLAAIRNNTPSPKLHMRRTSSYDMLTNAAPNPQYQQQQRPSSQGAMTALGGGGHGRNNSSMDIGSHLSAREQEHLARMTGAPLLNVAPNSRNAQQPAGGPGLVGAIAAREREKQQMKDGVSSQAVQYAINQRQQLQYQQQQAAQQQYYLQQQLQLQQQQQQYAQMYGTPSPPAAGVATANYNGYQLPPGHGPPQPRSPQPMQMQNTYVPPQGYFNSGGSVAGWNMSPQQQQQYQQQQHQQGYAQSSYGGGGQAYYQQQQPQQQQGQYVQYATSQAPRSRTPGPSSHHPGQAL